MIKYCQIKKPTNTKYQRRYIDVSHIRKIIKKRISAQGSCIGVSGIDFASFYDFDISFWNCFDRENNSVCNIPSHTAKCSLYSPNNSSTVTAGCDRRVKCLVFCVVICRSLFVHLSFFFLTLCCLSFFNLPILITFLVSSSYS